MSTNANCRIGEKEPGKWFYDLQKWPYGDNNEYETAGPFKTYAEAVEHLDKHHANPGGWSRTALPGCPHDMLEEERSGKAECQRCGEHVNITSPQREEAEFLLKEVRQTLGGQHGLDEFKIEVPGFGAYKTPEDLFKDLRSSLKAGERIVGALRIFLKKYGQMESPEESTASRGA